MLFIVSLGPAGGNDSNASEISLSSEIHSIRGAIYFFFSMIFNFKAAQAPKESAPNPSADGEPD